MNDTITIERGLEILNGIGDGQIFTVVFVKRTTGELRTMNCRKGVKKGVTGEGLAFDPNEKGLIPVFDMKADGFRMISIEGIREIRAGGERYEVAA